MCNSHKYILKLSIIYLINNLNVYLISAALLPFMVPPSQWWIVAKYICSSTVLEDNFELLVLHLSILSSCYFLHVLQNIFWFFLRLDV